MRVIFFGTPQFSAHVLEFLIKKEMDIVAVVSKPDRPKGRSGAPVPTPVKLAAHKLNPSLPVLQPILVSDQSFAPTLQAFNADLFVVVAYGEIIKEHLLHMPKIACINLHTSLLPKYRGAAPIQRAIIGGETETGVTIMHMAKKMDAGDIILQKKVPIGPEMTFGELEDTLCEVGKEALFETIQKFAEGKELSIPQKHEEATFAPKIELEDCEIHWNKPAEEIHNLVRGVNPYPGAWCNVSVKGDLKRLKIYRTKIIPSNEKSIPGKLLNQKGNIVLSTSTHALELLEVQLEGKKRMTSDELIRGVSLSHIKFNIFGA